MKNFLVLMLLVTQVSFAESYIKAAMTGAEMQEKGLLLDYLKLGCKDPGAVHNQLPPHDIKVFCHQESCRWRLGAPTKVTKQNYKSVCGKILTNKPNLGTLNKCSGCTAVPTTFELPNLYEECGKYYTQYAVTCEQVLAMTSVEAFCLDKTDADLTSDIDVMEWKASGKTMSATMGPETTVRQK